MMKVSRCWLWLLGVSGAVAAAPVDFEKEIAPILQEKCFLCHSAGVKKPKAGLRVDAREDLEKFQGDEPLLVPGKPEQSSFYTRVALPHDDADLMPPEGKKDPLAPAQVELIRRWIVEGASFGKWTKTAASVDSARIAAADVPKTTVAAVEAVEALLEAGRKKAGVTRTRPISDAVFLRRIYLDVAGRIPTIEEAEKFLQGSEANKRARLIDELLASEAHVSHFYNYWADVFRIRDGRWGDVAIQSFQAWIKEAIRSNLPWNRWIAEILHSTGNGLENPAVGYWYRDYEMPLDNLAYTTQTLLGTQFDCAVCHNHPFDKWSQYEFFELAAFLNQPRYSGHLPGWVTKDLLLNGVPQFKQVAVEENGKQVIRWIEAKPENDAAAKKRQEERARSIEEKLRAMTIEELGENVGTSYVRGVFSGYVQDWSRRRVDEETAKRKSGHYKDPVEGARNYSAARLVEVFNGLLHFRLYRQGNEVAQLPDDYQYSDAKPKDWVKPSVPFGTAPERKPGQPIHGVLAAWLTSPENPRFTKTIANRLFAYVFGRGLYPEHDNLRDDSVSSHPELTALLEGLMREHGYDLREYLRVLYNTPTYQSAAIPMRSQSDENGARPNWPWTFQGGIVRRLSAEQFWDSIVTLSLPRPDQRKRYFRYRDRERWKDLTKLDPEALLARGREVVEEEYQLRLIEAARPETVLPSHREPLLMPSATYRGFPEDLARASELPQPVSADHFLRAFGASDREMIENSNRSTTVPQTLALMNRLVDGYVLAPPNARRGFRGSPVGRLLASDASVAKKVEALYLAILTRRPEPEEIKVTSSFKSEDDLRDLAWALINSEEFRLWW